jgi:hypothetical protein
MRTVIASFDFKIGAYGNAERSGQWKAPGRGIPGALAFPGDWRGRWGNATGHYKRRGSAIQPMPDQAKGSKKAGPSAPLSPFPSVHTRKEMSKSLTMKLRLGWGGNRRGVVAFGPGPGGVPSTTLADVLTPRLVANPFSAMRASLRR